MSSNQLLELRKQWFKLKAKEFMQRYLAGLLVLVFFLPSVAIGENLYIFLEAISKPLLIISSTEATFTSCVMWLLVVCMIFLVWTRAQSLAISGGEFMQYMQSLPITHMDKLKNSILMLLVSNHFLWAFIAAGLFFLYESSENRTQELIRYLFLTVYLLTLQFVSINKNNTKNYVVLTFIGLFFITPIKPNYEWVRVLTLSIMLIAYMHSLSMRKPNRKADKNKKAIRVPFKINKGLYWQFLANSNLISTFFRFSIISFLMCGFALISQHLMGIGGDSLLPYFISLEGLIAYYFSGFFVVFKDQRLQMESLLLSLPVKATFWPSRDILVVFVLTLCAHLLFSFWSVNYFDISILLNVFLYHLFLLIIIYPIRATVKKRQTFISFVILFIITVITLFNL